MAVAVFPALRGVAGCPETFLGLLCLWSGGWPDLLSVVMESVTAASTWKMRLAISGLSTLSNISSVSGVPSRAPWVEVGQGRFAPGLSVCTSIGAVLEAGLLFAICPQAGCHSGLLARVTTW